MLTVEEKEIIRRDYFIHRKSMRQIARERHHSRKTIRKALYDPGVPVYSRSKPSTTVSQTSLIGYYSDDNRDTEPDYLTK
jgi:hypothetical protein